MLFLLGFKVQAAQTMHKNGVVLSPPFQSDLSQMKDAWFPTWCKLQKNARPILLCHKLIFRRCWKARKCNYGKIALRQTSTCQVLPFSITHLSPLIVADNAPSVCALAEGKKYNPKSSAWMEEWEKWGQLPEEAHIREPLQSHGGIQEPCASSGVMVSRDLLQGNSRQGNLSATTR